MGDLITTKYQRSRLLAIITGFADKGTIFVMYMDGGTQCKSGKDFEMVNPYLAIEDLSRDEVDSKRIRSHKQLMNGREEDLDTEHYHLNKYSTFIVEYNLK